MPIRPALAATLLVLAAGCTRGGGAASPPERFLPAGASVAVLVPRVRDAQAQASALARTVLTFPAAARAGEVLAALREQLGLDPLDPGALEGAGIDVDRGAALALEDGHRPLLCLPVGDAARLDALLARLARDRLGAGRRETARVAGEEVVTFRAREGAPAALAYAVSRRNALVAPGADGPARAAAAATRPEVEALSASPDFRRARNRIDAASAVVVYLPPGSGAASSVPLARDGVALGLGASATRLAARVALLLTHDRAAWWRTALAPAEAAPAAPGARDAGAAPARRPTAAALSRLPPEAFLAGRFDGDVAETARRALPLLSSAVAALGPDGVDAGRDALPLLAPGAAAALTLAPTFDVATASHASDLGAQDPFRLVHLAAVLVVKDAPAVGALLDRLRRAPPRAVKVAPAPAGARRGWTVTWGRARLELALDGGLLLAGGGPGVLAGMLARGAGGAPSYQAPSDDARQALTGGMAGGVVDFGQLVSSFRALPQQAYGSGPDAFVMRSLADRVVDPASRLVAASARLDLAGDAALVDLVVEARPAEGTTR